MTVASSERAKGSAPPVTLIGLMNVLLSHRALMITLPLLIAGVVVAVNLLLPRSFTATVAFVPVAPDRSLGSLTGLAAQFGVNLGGALTGESPDLYVDVVQSREVLGKLVEGEYSIASPRGALWWRDTVLVTGTLMDIFEIDKRGPAENREIAIEELRDMMSASAGPTTGIVRVSVRTRWPELSHEISRRLLVLLQEFNLQTRQTQAGAERRFIEDRVSAAQEELRLAENALERFLQGNRSWEDSPQLVFEHERLSRQVALHQQVYTSLAQTYEQARIDEVRNTPVFTVLEHPKRPARPDRRRTLLKALVSLVLGAIAAVVASFTIEAVKEANRENPSDAERFKELRRDVMDGVRRVLGRRKRET